MITCTVDYDRRNYTITAMLTDTTFSGGFARIDIDVYNNTVSYTVRYNNGRTRVEEFDKDVYTVEKAAELAVYEIADTLAYDAFGNDNGMDNYDIAYTRIRLALGTKLHIF